MIDCNHVRTCVRDRSRNTYAPILLADDLMITASLGLLLAVGALVAVFGLVPTQPPLPREAPINASQVQNRAVECRRGAGPSDRESASSPLMGC